MTPREIAERLAQDVESVCSTLLPNGKRVGHEWCCGSVSGEAGDSLKVRLTGTKAGVWRDFAGNDKGGDLLDLWRVTRNVRMVDAIRDAKQFLGIRDDAPDFHPKRRTTSRTVKPPNARPMETVFTSSAVDQWLDGRKIPLTTQQAYKLLQDGSTCIFPCYHDDHLVMLKFRDIAQAKKIWASKDSTPVLFGWQAVPDEARTIVLTEGEVDAMSYHAQGIPALSLPFGGGKGAKQDWIENEYDRLERFDTIYISTDMDAEGDAAAAEIIERLGRHRCMRVTLPVKDANEAHMRGDELWKAIVEAKHVDPSELRAASSFLPEVMDAFFSSTPTAQGVELPWEITHERFRLRRGELTIWTGINGHGKTMLLDHIAVHGMAQNGRWCLASMEMSAPIHLKRIFSQVSGATQPTEEIVERINRWIDGRCWIFNVRGTAKASRILDVFRYAWRKYGIGSFIVDSLAKCGYAEDDYNGQKGFVESLQDFAMESQTHVHLVTHARKQEGEEKPPGKMDVKGTGAITDMADNVVSVWRNKRKEELLQSGAATDATKSEPDCLVIVHKQRNHGWEGKFKLWYNPTSHQYREERSPLIDYLGANAP